MLETSEERVLDDGTVRRATTVIVRFAKLGLVDQLFHTVARPAVTSVTAPFSSSCQMAPQDEGGHARREPGNNPHFSTFRTFFALLT